MNITEFIVILLVWNIANDYSSETSLIVALIIIAILSIQSLSVGLGLTISKVAVVYDRQFLAIRKLLSDVNSPEIEDEIIESEPQVKSMTIKMYINSFGIGICYFASLIMLFVSASSL